MKKASLRLIAVALVSILLITMTPVFGLMAPLQSKALAQNSAQDYQNIVIISDSRLYMNVEENHTFYVKSGAVLRLYNCVVRGDLVVFGAAILSNVQVEGSLYCSSMIFSNSNPSTLYNGYVYYVGPVSISQLTAASMDMALGTIPYRIDECYFIDNRLYVKGSILNVVDVYINNVKLNIAEDGSVEQWLDIQPTDDPLNLTFVTGSTKRIEKLTAAEVEKDSSGNVNYLPSITATDSTVCKNRSDLVNLNASAYDKEDGNITNKLQKDFSKVDYTKEGSYTVTLSVTDSKGGTKTKAVTIKVVDHDYNVSKQDATCTAPGLTSYTCKICGDKKEESTPALEHNWVLKDTRAATCTTTGTEVYKCSKCGNTRTEEIPASGHSKVVLPAVPATCTSSGLTAGEKCEKCNQILKEQEVIPATGHTWNAGTVTQAPTCADKGTVVYTCSVCGATKTEEAATTENHKWDVGVVTKAATCTTEGIKTYTCTLCNKTKTEPIPSTGNHLWNDGVVIQAATCTAEGAKKYTCTSCGETKTESIPISEGHSWDSGVIIQNATCTAEGVKKFSCLVCGETKTEPIPVSEAHLWNNGVLIRSATCKTTGEKKYTCTICGAVKNETVPATGAHVFDSGVITKPATCTTAGVKTYTCTNCKETRTETIPATGHKYKTVAKAATTSENGSRTKTCTICGFAAQTEIINRIDSVTLKKKTVVYTGNVRQPAVTVTDSSGKTISAKYYTVKYSKGCTDIGTYKVRVTFKGIYSGKVYRNFKIVPGRVTDLDAVSKKAGTATLSWSPVKGAQKYVIYYSTSKNDGYKKLAVTKKTAYNVKDLKSGKGYYFIVKSFARVNDNGYYGAKSNRDGARIK